tara:strand:- start:1300 stop:2853 length:1554 start_codon:yes stop_codon:yes gene_type:complete
MPTANEMLASAIGDFVDDPLGYVMYVFPWKDNPTIQLVELQEPYKTRFNCDYGPDLWACEMLDQLGDEIKKRGFNGRDAVDAIRFSTASGHGIGKSTMVAWLIMFILDTRPMSMGVVTANTGDQLRTKTWAALAQWHHLAITSHLWDYSNSRGNMSLRRRGPFKDVWKCDGLTARAENAEAFQGLHAASSTAFYIFDEASGIEDAIWDARIGGATDGEPMSFDFGNPTRKSGYFFENCVGDQKHRYIVRQIDSRDAKITNPVYLEELRHDWGEDSDLFKVKVRGIFPTVGSVQFMSNDQVREAMSDHREVQGHKNDPVLIGVDIARFGDNETVLFTRIGMDARSIPIRSYNRLDLEQVVDKVIELVDDIHRMGKRVSGLFLDGGGLGAGPVDRLRRLGYNPIDVNFGKSATDSRFRRWGDEMYGNLRDHIGRIALPRNEDLRKQLTQREYNIEGNGKLLLESKKDMRQRGLQSPDIADALALTFAKKIAPGYKTDFGNSPQQVIHEWNPYSEKHMNM